MRLIRKALMVMGGFTSTDFTYTGTYVWVDDGIINGKPSFRIKFLTSGVFTPKKPLTADVFLVAGGGGGGSGISSGSGGGGGYTATYHAVTLAAGTAYTISVGNGGAPNYGGGVTSISPLSLSVGGGWGGTGAGAYNYSNVVGAQGGSGGGGNGSGVASTYWDGGNGGSNGSNGYPGGSGVLGGAGQGTTTREFGEASGALYADGGGGAGYYSTKLGGLGGSGLGGRGFGSQGSPTSGQTNTGSGGGGAAKGSATAGYGGSGVLIIRNKRN